MEGFVGRLFRLGLTPADTGSCLHDEWVASSELVPALGIPAPAFTFRSHSASRDADTSDPWSRSRRQAKVAGATAKTPAQNSIFPNPPTHPPCFSSDWQQIGAESHLGEFTAGALDGRSASVQGDLDLGGDRKLDFLEDLQHLGIGGRRTDVVRG